MTWNEVTTNAIDIKKTKNESYEGVFLSQKEVSTKIGPQVIWQFEGEDGHFGIYGFTNLNRAMAMISEGTRVKITYLGTKKIETKYGLKDVHQVSVQRWAEENEQADEVGGKPF